LITFQVKKNTDDSAARIAQSQLDVRLDKKGKRPRRPTSEIHSQMLGSDVDDFEDEDDDNGTCVNAKYCIMKEEYPPELLRTFDIV